MFENCHNKMSGKGKKGKGKTEEVWETQKVQRKQDSPKTLMPNNSIENNSELLSILFSILRDVGGCFTKLVPKRYKSSYLK